ncbi:MAG: hypothetical protein ABIE68_02345 [bacterium]
MKYPYARITFYSALILNLIIWALSYYMFPPESETVILHYNVYFGVDLFDVWWKILIIPLVGLVLWIINLAIARFMYLNNKPMRIILGAVTIVIQVILLISLIAIWAVNNANNS